MKKAIIINSLEILMGIVFLVLASYNNLGSSFLKSVLGGVGAILVVVAVFDIVNRCARASKTKQIRDRKK